MKIKMYTYDVVGNQDDGWEVNDRFDGKEYDVKEGYTKEDIIEILKAEGLYEEGMTVNEYAEGYTTVDRAGGKPLCEFNEVF